MNDFQSPNNKYPNIPLGTGESAQSIFANDSHPAAEHYQNVSITDMGIEDVPVSAYTPRDWFEQEKEKL